MPIDEDNDMSVLAYNKYLEEDAERNKNKIANEFEQMGDKFLQEIERKKKINTLRSEKLIPYILKHRGDIYEEDELKSYSFEDIQDIYDEVKKEKRPAIVKFINFIFNFE